MRIKILHMLLAGVTLALAVSLLLAPSVWQIYSQPQTLRATGGETADTQKGPPSEAFTHNQPDMQNASIGVLVFTVVAVVVGLSFKLTRRLEESTS